MNQAPKSFIVPDYTKSPSGPADHAIAFVLGFAAGFAVLFIFYKILPLSFFGGLLAGGANILAAAKHYDVDVAETDWRQLGKRPHTSNPAHESNS